MQNRSRSSLWYLIPILLTTFIFCGEIPDDPAENPDLAKIELLTQSIAGKMVTVGDCVELDLLLEYSHYFDSISVYTSCKSYDTTIHIFSDKPFDTCTITPCFLQAGTCTLYVHATMRNPGWKDLIRLENRETSLPLIIHSASDTGPSDSTGDSLATLTPAYSYIPERIVVGQPDTLLFTVDNNIGSDSITIALVDKDALDPEVFAIIPSGADSIRIAVNPDAAAGSANIGIVISDATRTDTSWYPVSITQGITLWNIVELPVEAVEGSEIQLGLSSYLTDTQAVVTSDMGTVLPDNVWSYTPSWGTAASNTAHLTAKTAENTTVLVLNVTIIPGDAAAPTVKIVKPELVENQGTVGASKLTLKCEVTDDQAGVSGVDIQYNKQRFEAIREDDSVYSGIIEGLVHGVPAEITIIAVDSSQKKNTSSVPFTVTYDSTMADLEAPVIEKLNGPSGDDRVTTAVGSISYSVSDDSGIDSVWWTLNDVFGGVVSLKEDGTYMFTYTLNQFGSNLITLHAQDGATNRNKTSLSITVLYNVPPTVPVIASPVDGAMGVNTTPTLTWTAGDDPDGDTVFYRILYQKSVETVFTESSEYLEKTGVINGLEPNTEYTWNVIAYSKTYPDTVASAIAAFTTAGTEPTIATQPSDPGEILIGDKFTLSVIVTGEPKPTCQWFRDGKALIGNSEPILTITEAQKSDAGDYYVVAENGIGKVTSTTVSVIIKQKIVITKNPEPQQVKEGESASFTVTADGDPVLAYQWLKDGEPLTDQISSTCRIILVTSVHTGTYTCKVSNGFSNAVSTGATLLVIPRYRVTYHANGTNGSDIPVDNRWYESGEQAKVLGKPVGLTKEGFEFIGWCYDKNGEGALFQKGYEISIGSADVVLYAVWEKARCKVTFDVNGGEPIQNSLTIEHGTSLGNRLPIIKKTSYVFENWKDKNGNVITDTTPIQKDMVLLASWVIKDIDGNIYTEVTIGDQVWMVENLKTTKYNDGTAIPLVTESSEWEVLETPGYCWYKNDASHKEPFGALYNWYAGNSEKLAPVGWHVPSDAEWTLLEEYLSENGFNYDGSTEGNKIAKSLASTTEWRTYSEVGTIGNNLSENNLSGFSAYPGGYRASNGPFTFIGDDGVWWSTTENDVKFALQRALYFVNISLTRNKYEKKSGLSVRCIRNY